MRTRFNPVRAAVIGLALISTAPHVLAFSSGSTGSDGALSPSVDTEVVLPASGILNYTSINIPSGVTVRFKKNTMNTPVVLLVSGDVTVAGTIDVSGKSAAASGSAGDGVLADDGNPGEGGPGGYAGGRGGRAGALDSLERLGGRGLGPGGGAGARRMICGTNNYDYEANGSIIGYVSGGGGSFGTAGGTGYAYQCPATPAGAIYGAAELLPLIGGSGGGGGLGGSQWTASGGGGGGGAILIAASGTITLAFTNSTNQGRIIANGGKGGDRASATSSCSLNDYAGMGGGGSGGAIRLVATTITGNGSLTADNGTGGTTGNCAPGGPNGGDGRIRLEADAITRTGGTTTPTASIGKPGPVFISGAPTLLITSVAGVAVPQPPTGVADVKLPATTPNPLTVSFTTTGIPVGNTVKLSVVPNNGAEVTAISSALTGSVSTATASASVTMPVGASTLQASVTYTVVVAVGESLSRFAQGERVERIAVTASLDGKSSVKLITVSGRIFDAPPEAWQIAAVGG